MFQKKKKKEKKTNNNKNNNNSKSGKVILITKYTSRWLLYLLVYFMWPSTMKGLLSQQL